MELPWENKMKKIFLICAIVGMLAASVPAASENAVRLDAQKRPKIVSKVDPVYPEEARKQKIQGVVEMEATINASGDVVGVRVLPTPSPQPLLAKAAVAALRQWKYEPYRINGKAMTIIFNVSITFSLQEDAPAVSREDPKVVKMVNPEYPKEAAKQGLQGVVKIEVTIDEKGNVAAVRVLPEEKPQPLLEEAALKAIKQWKFEPFVRDGKVVRLTFDLNVTFVLQ